MLKITIPATEMYDEMKNEFVYIKEQELQLEHSLVSLSKWESKWHKPFLSKDEKTVEETIDYIRCMTLTQNVNPNIYMGINSDILKKVMDYINDPMTATKINDTKKKTNREIITAELIYYWMISLGIPVEFQKWHLNKLFTLISVCSIKNAPSKKMSRREVLEQNRAINAARRKKH